MHSTFTPDLARQIVNDRLRDAEGRRLARAVRRTRSISAHLDGTGSTERVVRRTSRLAVFFGRTAQAH